MAESAHVNANVNANVHTNEYVVQLFNRYAHAVPRDLWMTLCEQQRTRNVFSEMRDGRYPDWAVMISTITNWKMLNDRDDYTYDLLSTAWMGDEARQREYALSFIQWWEQRFIISKPFNRPPQRPLRTHEHANSHV